MSTIVTRAAKGSPLTHAEVDANFTNLNTDKYQSGDSVTFTTLTANSISEFGRSSANYWQAVGAATTLTPQFVTLGSDTNIPVTFRSKGTGAVNLAPGSRGVNISNGGTVTAITRTAAGSGYTSFPSIAISAPTTAGGVQATASVVQMVSNNPTTVAAGGTGYTNGDVLTLVGGTPSAAAATFTVTGVSGGVVTSVTATNFGSYTVLPTNPVSTTGGTGSGCTLNVTYGIQAGLTITNAGSGYVEQPTVTFSGGGGSGAAAYATVGGGAVIRALGITAAQTLDIVGPNYITSSIPMLRFRDIASADSFPTLQNSAFGSSNFVGSGNANAGLGFYANGTGNVILGSSGSSLVTQFRVAHTGSAVNFVQVTGAATGNTVQLSAQGSDTNVRLRISDKGTGGIEQFSNGVRQFFVWGPSNAVNYFYVNGAAATAQPTISVLGSDTNVGISLSTKGTGPIRFFTNGGSSEQFRVVDTAGTIVNYATATGSATGAAPAFSVAGSDTNIDLALTPKGTGLVRFGTRTATSDVAITGYLEIKDSGGTTRKLAIID